MLHICWESSVGWQKMGRIAKTKTGGNGCHLLPWWWGCGIAPAEADRCGSQTGAARLQLVRPPGSQASPEQTDPWVVPTGFLAWQVEDRWRHCSTTEMVFCSRVQYGLCSKSSRILKLGTKVSPSVEDPPPGFQNLLGTVLRHVSRPARDLTVAICTAETKTNPC